MNLRSMNQTKAYHFHLLKRPTKQESFSLSNDG